MEVIYKKPDGTILGTTKHSDFDEILIPEIDTSYVVYLKHKFQSVPSVQNWLVKDCVVDKSLKSAVFVLNEESKASSLSKYCKSQKQKHLKHLNSHLDDFCIAEVEFGFRQQVMTSTGKIKLNSNYPSSPMGAEIHKRRPCIVFRAKERLAQVIPLSTDKTRDEDPTRIQISEDSFKNLASRYSKKTSYALVEMLQAVSGDRIFPPTSKNGKHTHRYRDFVISNEDKDAIKAAVGGKVAREISTTLRISKRQVESLNKEKNRILSNKSDIEAKLDTANSSLEQRNIEINRLKNGLMALAEDVGAGDNWEDVWGYIENSVEENIRKKYPIDFSNQ